MCSFVLMHPCSMKGRSDEYIREAVEKCKGHIVHSHYGAWNFSQKKNGEIVQDPSPSSGDLINYPAFVEALYHKGLYRLPHIRILFAGVSKITSWQESKR